MAYKLKKGIENFQVVDGPFAGRKFGKGKEYSEAEVPPEEAKKFEEVKPVEPVDRLSRKEKKDSKAKPKS